MDSKPPRYSGIIAPAGRDFEPMSPADLRAMAERARELRDLEKSGELSAAEKTELASLTQDGRRL